MPRRTNPKGVLLWSLLLSPLVGALQQHSQHDNPATYPQKVSLDELRDGGQSASTGRRWASSVPEAGAGIAAAVVDHGKNVARTASLSGSASGSGKRGLGNNPRSKNDNNNDDNHNKNRENTHRASFNERALATLSPAGTKNPAVRAPPAPGSSAATAAGGPASRSTRSLQDWRVEDIMLLATVDGKIHARDRRTGAALWQLDLDPQKPMVETVYHTPNKSESGGDGPEAGYAQQRDPLWIVEPSQDGSIYVYIPGSNLGMQKLDFTVADLVNYAPYDSQSKPSVTYTAEKRAEVYTVVAGTGKVLKRASSTGTSVTDDRKCRTVNLLEPLDDAECEPVGTITLGRMEYTIGIAEGDRQITTIRFSEWVPNKRDLDLYKEYTDSMDNKYVYTRHDGTIFGLDLGSSTNYRSGSWPMPTFVKTLSAPVARIFDVVRPSDDLSSDAALVLLPQPTAPMEETMKESAFERIFVDCTPNGSWYALSEMKYPGVTDSAAPARMYQNEVYKLGLPSMVWPPTVEQRAEFTGVHPIRPADVSRELLLDAPDLPGIEAPPPGHVSPNDSPEVSEPHSDRGLTLRTLLIASLAALAIFCAGGVAYGTRQKKLMEEPSSAAQVADQKRAVQFVEGPSDIQVADGASKEAVGAPTASLSVENATVDDRVPEVTVIEPDKEIIFPHEAPNPPEPAIEDPKSEEGSGMIDTETLTTVVTPEQDKGIPEANEPKKKRGAHRGKRGGRKAKEKEQQQAGARAEKAEKLERVETSDKAEKVERAPERPVPTIVTETDPAKVVGVLQINSLIIHTDRVIGQGSCGTSVFEGSFEGRAVAVKRMLSQYYELASQEVSFLQQSDDHPNVIRYFCQQRDDHFLYIAVELCQASLFEVWEPEKARTEERQQQLRNLKFSILKDPPKALHQLAAGLYHLHNLRIIHRDIKPQNILVAFPKKNRSDGPQLVISDFGLGKNLPENVSTLIDPTGNAGTSGWKAPELISQPRDTDSRHSQSGSHTGTSENAGGGSTSGVKRAADIFSLGCLFFWVLTDGVHPYEDENGWHQLRELNIKRDHKKMDVLERWSDAYEPMQLITSMLAHQPEQRPTAQQVLNHPFFWSATKRLTFLCDCSDHFEREPRGVWEDGYAGDSYDLSLLESRGEEVIGAPFEHADFLVKLDRLFVDTLGKQRKYSGNRMLDLLRALRNKKNHYEDMPEEVKRRTGSLPEGYLNFWCHRFPRLLMACYEVILECGLDKTDRFKGYFVATS